MEWTVEYNLYLWDKNEIIWYYANLIGRNDITPKLDTLTLISIHGNSIPLIKTYIHNTIQFDFIRLKFKFQTTGEWMVLN